ncbi:conserved Plasmodium protein, unknown function [Plasmodium ovale curtisi]|uniref:B box-type domain-containing protein n=1 Tax=Plasmodium ovale curtisi TaxID=864141 RepID=A0A1A8WPB0_PLAOA|nr:conserved Plasmodium protein, unknown function [Plasmodium ovale curtisi]
MVGNDLPRENFESVYNRIVAKKKLDKNENKNIFRENFEVREITDYNMIMKYEYMLKTCFFSSNINVLKAYRLVNEEYEKEFEKVSKYLKSNILYSIMNTNEINDASERIGEYFTKHFDELKKYNYIIGNTNYPQGFEQNANGIFQVYLFKLIPNKTLLLNKTNYTDIDNNKIPDNYDSIAIERSLYYDKKKEDFEKKTKQKYYSNDNNSSEHDISKSGLIDGMITTCSSNSCKNGLQYSYLYKVKNSEQLLPLLLIKFEFKCLRVDISIPICESCSINNALYYCYNDKVHLCDICDIKHHEKNIILKNHKRIHISESPFQFGKCPYHPNELVETICMKCFCSLCSNCLLIGNHSKDNAGNGNMNGIGSDGNMKRMNMNKGFKNSDGNNMPYNNNSGSGMNNHAYENKGYNSNVDGEGNTKSGYNKNSNYMNNYDNNNKNAFSTLRNNLKSDKKNEDGMYGGKSKDLNIIKKDDKANIKNIIMKNIKREDGNHRSNSNVRNNSAIGGGYKNNNSSYNNDDGQNMRGTKNYGKFGSDNEGINKDNHNIRKGNENSSKKNEEPFENMNRNIKGSGDGDNYNKNSNSYNYNIENLYDSSLKYVKNSNNSSKAKKVTSIKTVKVIATEKKNDEENNRHLDSKDKNKDDINNDGGDGASYSNNNESHSNKYYDHDSKKIDNNYDDSHRSNNDNYTYESDSSENGKDITSKNLKSTLLQNKTKKKPKKKMNNDNEENNNSYIVNNAPSNNTQRTGKSQKIDILVKPNLKKGENIWEARTNLLGEHKENSNALSNDKDSSSNSRKSRSHSNKVSRTSSKRRDSSARRRDDSRRRDRYSRRYDRRESRRDDRKSDRRDERRHSRRSESRRDGSRRDGSRRDRSRRDESRREERKIRNAKT